MTSTIDLVDSIEYTTTNCFAHQLHQRLHQVDPSIQTVALNDINSHLRPKRVISRLKQRTLFRCAERLGRWLGSTPVVVFDQDPWESFRDGSPYFGAYRHIVKHLNVTCFAVTTQWWADYLNNVGLPSTFVKMWVLPELCTAAPAHDDRSIALGFMGGLHPYRKMLFDKLKTMDLDVTIIPGAASYPEYMRSLSSMKVYVHCEDFEYAVPAHNNASSWLKTNLSEGLWIKDVEAAARGCFSIRNRGMTSGVELSYVKNIETIKLYDDASEVPDIIDGIKNMDPQKRQELLSDTVESIRKADEWAVTANTLVDLASVK